MYLLLINNAIQFIKVSTKRPLTLHYFEVDVMEVATDRLCHIVTYIRM